MDIRALVYYRDGALYRTGTHTPAGGGGGHSYLRVSIENRRYYVHRVVWYLHFGTWPEQLDHIDGNRINNRIENLREVSVLANNLNRQVCKRRGRGVYLTGAGKWQAQVSVGGKTRYLGRFHTQQEAIDAYEQAIRGREEAP